MQVVKLSILIVSILYNCSPANESVISQGNFKIIKYKSQDDTSYINMKSFFFEEKTREIPAYYRVNNIVFPPLNPDEHLTINVLEGNFTIEAGSVTKEEIVIQNLKISKGDSVVVKFYLKDNPEPLH